MSRTLVVVSHAAEEYALAEAWKILICGAFPAAHADAIFLSSERGAPHYQQSRKKIGEAAALISIQSPLSCKRPWIMFEGGVAAALEKSVYPVIYEQRDVSKAASIWGPRPEYPLSSLQQYRGVERSDAAAILDLLAEDFERSAPEPKPVLEAAKLKEALDDYELAVGQHEKSWIRRRTIFEKRVVLSFEREEREQLRDTGVIPDTIEVESVGDSMLIFDTTEESAKWGAFMRHLEGMELPWAGSAVRWARGLGHALQRALGDELSQAPEGLPLYFDARPSQRRSYRPTVALREEIGGITYFVISFTLLPPELRIRPDGRSGVFLHYLDFSRMLRWGVLEDRRFVDFFIDPGETSVSEGRAVVIDFIERILTIRTEFWNRGLKTDALAEVVPVEDLDKVRALEKRYTDTIALIDPGNKGVLPDPLPSIPTLQEVYAKLLHLNKDYYEIVHHAFGREVESLATSLLDIR